MKQEGDELVLYRGIAVSKQEADTVCKNILSEGIIGDEGKWRIGLNDLRENLNILFNKSNLNTNHTRKSKEQFRIISACGNNLGASYYALEHNRRKDKEEIPFIIKFKVPLKDIYIDGKEFLYTCFQRCNSADKELFKVQREVLVGIYGKKITKYLTKAAKSDDDNYKLAICDLAIQDLDIIRKHYFNEFVIKGRYNVHFCSAFLVKAPIHPDQIISVEVAETREFNPQVRLSDILRKSNKNYK